MKKICKELGAAWVMGFLLPGFILSGAVFLGNETSDPKETVVFETEDSEEKTVSVLTETGTIETMGLETYLAGVVLAEMPASFEEEALKAQAVVARTYTLRSAKHEGASVCTDSTCCQGYVSETDYLAQGGTWEDVDRILSAVKSTAGYVLTYEGELIEATYFSCSGGTTEDASAVWGADVPYLQAVTSPGEEHAAHFTDTVTFDPAEFAALLGIDPEGEPETWFGAVTHTAGGGVETMVIGAVEFSGTQLRQLLNLRSTACTFTVADGTIQITTRGYGHRVGMSQYGADAMAVLGHNYEEILSHYYQGAALELWDD